MFNKHTPLVISIIHIASPNPMFDHLIEMSDSHQDNSNKWSDLQFGEEITQVESIKIYFILLLI